MGNEEGKFSLNSSTGVVKLVHPLDYESTKEYYLVIRAMDQDPRDPRTAKSTLVVYVIDVNDNHPTFLDETTVVDIPENTAVGMLSLLPHCFL